MRKCRHIHTSTHTRSQFFQVLHWFKVRVILMTVFLCPYRVPVAIFVSGRPVVLDATLQLSVWSFKSRPAWPTFLPCAPLTTSQHTWLVLQPLSASIRQCPESQAPLRRWKCPAVLWLRAGVTLRWGGMLCAGAYVIGCIILFIPLGICSISKIPINVSFIPIAVYVVVADLIRSYYSMQCEILFC